MSIAAASSSRPDPLRWGIASTGRIAGVFARDLATAQMSELVAVGSRTAESARTFAAEHGIAAERAHGSMAALFADPTVDAVYVATPHPMHCEVVVAALRAGKHVLCEKPIAMNLAEVNAMQTAAREHDRTLMEAWMYRCHPQTQRLVSLIREGVIGELRHIQGAFGFAAEYDPAGRLWSKELGGGGILDVGGYPLSYARLLAGAAQGLPFVEPETLAGVGVLHPQSAVDTQATAVLKFPGDITAEISCSTLVNQDNVLRVYGTEGWIHVASPFVINRQPTPTELTWHRVGADAPEAIMIESDRGLYAYEADAFATAVQAGEQEVPACTWADTRGNLGAQLEWCRQLGLRYA